MRQHFLTASFLAVVTLGAAAGCDDNTTTITAPTDVTFGLADFVEILFSRSVPITVGDEESVNYFPVSARHFTVFDDDVLVFEFVGPNTTAAFAATVSPDGSTINGRVIDWPATPHFFTSGRVIVLYLGNNTQVLLAISDVMGAQFAGGEFVFASQAS